MRDSLRLEELAVWATAPVSTASKTELDRERDFLAPSTATAALFEDEPVRRRCSDDAETAVVSAAELGLHGSSAVALATAALAPETITDGGHESAAAVPAAPPDSVEAVLSVTSNETL